MTVATDGAPASTRIGLGTGPLGGLFSEVSDDQARETVEAAWAAGIRLFDTAPLYGSGLAERRLGEALARRPRHELTISTKVGRVLEPGPPSRHYHGAPELAPRFDFRPEAIRRSLTESLERLQLDEVDIALIHDPEEHLDDVRRAIDTAWELAPHVGVGTNVVATALALVERGEIDVVLLAGRYTLLDRSAEHELLPLCAERGVRYLAAGVFNSGLLAGGTTYDYDPAPPRLTARAAALAEICHRHGVPLAAAALQLPLRNPAVHSIVVGARSAAEVEEDTRLVTVPIPDELWAELGP